MPSYLSTVLFVIETCFCLLGLCYAPYISDSQMVTADVCPKAPGANFGGDQCASNDRTFYFRMPFDTSDGGFSRWQYPLRAIFQLTEYRMREEDIVTDMVDVMLNVKLSYSDEADGHWCADSGVLMFLTLSCRKLAHRLACSPIPILMLETTKHPFYMISVQLLNSTSDTRTLGATGAMLNVITQNRIFCKFWIMDKIVLSFCSGFVLYMFLDRMKAAKRAATFFEKIIRLLLWSLFIQDLPLEQLLTILGLPFGTSLSVLTSGVYFSSLLAAWLVFVCQFIHPTALSAGISKQRRMRNSVCYVVSSTVLIIYNMYLTAMGSLNPFYNAGDGQIGWVNVISATGAFFTFVCFMCAQLRSWRAGRIQIIIRPIRNFPASELKRRVIAVLVIGLACALHGAGGFLLSEITNTQYALASWKWLDLAMALQGTSYYYVLVYYTWTMYINMLTLLNLPEKAEMPQLDDSQRLIIQKKQKIK